MTSHGLESSFLQHLQQHNPELVPTVTGSSPGFHTQQDVAEATTIVAVTYRNGVMMAGDRRATVGNRIASSRMEKVFPADAHSLVGVAGAAGVAIDIARLFSVELEHYEKIEGTELSLLGKTNRLAALVRAQFSQAVHQGLVALPLFAGVDIQTQPAGSARIFSFDVTGGRFEEHHHHSIGSGAPFAAGALKRMWHENLESDEALDLVLRALVDAAEEDAATAGPDPTRGLWPVVYTTDIEGTRKVPESDIQNAVTRLWNERGSENS